MNIQLHSYVSFPRTYLRPIDAPLCKSHLQSATRKMLSFSAHCSERSELFSFVSLRSPQFRFGIVNTVLTHTIHWQSWNAWLWPKTADWNTLLNRSIRDMSVVDIGQRSRQSCGSNVDTGWLLYLTGMFNCSGDGWRFLTHGGCDMSCLRLRLMRFISQPGDKEHMRPPATLSAFYSGGK